jgi:tetratricopeptide (TPR) repeat protein
MKYKRSNHLLSLTLLLFVFTQLKALAQIFGSELLEQRATALYYQGAYSNVSQAIAIYVDSNTTEANWEYIDYFNLVTALRLNSPGAVKAISSFTMEYPTNPVIKTVYLDLANFYFNNERYSYAYKWFLRVKEADVPVKFRPQFYFNKGYTLFSKKQYKGAKSLLEKVVKNPKFESDAHYYLGHIAYQLEDYQGASSSFTRVSKKNQQDDLGYFQVEMNFKLGRFEKALKLGKVEIEKAEGETLSQLFKILGECHFNLEQYEAALDYLKRYKGRKGKWNHVDYFQLGYTYYKTNDYANAIDQFNKIIVKKDALSQNAYYYLAECYLMNESKSAALNAYKSASSMKYNPKISQAALLNYVRLSYEIGNPYEQVPTVIIRFLESYPNAEEKEEMTALLLDSYTNSGNYDGVIKLLELRKGDYKDDTLLQRVYFLKGSQLFHAGDYQEAKNLFDKSIKKSKDNVLTAQSVFWKAQSNFELNRYEEALDAYFEFKSNPASKLLLTSLLFHYHLGYTYFKLEDFTAAIKAFKSVVEEKESMLPSLVRDTYLRLGDCNFAQSSYWPAMEYYNKSIRFSPAQSDYAFYQKAISYGFVDRNDKKIETLKELILKHKKSPYLDDAYFELSKAYAVAGSFDIAIKTYDQLVGRFRKSPYVSRAILNKGLILYNQEKLRKAEAVLKGLVIRYSNNSVSHQALRTLKEIALDLDDVQAFTAWIKGLSFKVFTDNELEKTAFDAAENQFLSNKKKQSKKSFLSYLASYPEGQNALTTRFYLAEIYFEEEDWTNALKYYSEIIDFELNEFSEKALVRATQIFVNQEQQEKAIPLWEQLDKVALHEENKRYAQLNLMKTYYRQSSYDQAILLAENILIFDNLDSKVKWDAQEIIAHGALKVGDSLKAQASFAILEKAPIDVLAAEAYHYRAQLSHQKKAYVESNEIIAALSMKFSRQPFWAAKSLLLMAKNFYELGDAFQATFILESMISNYTQFQDLNDEGNQVLNKIKQQQAEKNASLTDQNTKDENQ